MPAAAKKMRPNHEAIAKLVKAPREKQAEQRFEGQGYDGLVLLMLPSGAASWYAYYRLKGRPQSKQKLGDFGTMSLEVAKLANNKVRVSVGEGVDPKAALRAGESFKTVAERALTDNAAWGKGTRKNYGYALRNDVFPIIGSLPINLVTEDDCRRVLAKINARKRFRQEENVRRIISAVFSWAKGERYTKTNPIAGIPVRAKPTRRKRVPSAGELWTVWHALDEGNTSKQVRQAIRFTILTALRRTEAAGLRCDERDGDKVVIQADVEAAGVVVSEGRMKNGRQQTIFLSRQAAAILDEAESDGGHFFPANPSRARGPLKTLHVNPGAITTRMNKISHDKGIPLLSIHDMRRAYTDWSENEGIAPAVQDAILHHTPQSTRERNYLAQDDDTERRARMKKLEARLRNAWQAWGDYVEKIVSAESADEAQRLHDEIQDAA